MSERPQTAPETPENPQTEYIDPEGIYTETSPATRIIVSKAPDGRSTIRIIPKDGDTVIIEEKTMGTNIGLNGLDALDRGMRGVEAPSAQQDQERIENLKAAYEAARASFFNKIGSELIRKYEAMADKKDREAFLALIAGAALGWDTDRLVLSAGDQFLKLSASAQEYHGPLADYAVTFEDPDQFRAEEDAKLLADIKAIDFNGTAAPAAQETPKDGKKPGPETVAELGTQERVEREANLLVQQATTVFRAHHEKLKRAKKAKLAQHFKNFIRGASVVMDPSRPANEYLKLKNKEEVVPIAGISVMPLREALDAYTRATKQEVAGDIWYRVSEEIQNMVFIEDEEGALKAELAPLRMAYAAARRAKTRSILSVASARLFRVLGFTLFNKETFDEAAEDEYCAANPDSKLAVARGAYLQKRAEIIEKLKSFGYTDQEILHFIVNDGAEAMTDARSLSFQYWSKRALGRWGKMWKKGGLKRAQMVTEAVFIGGAYTLIATLKSLVRLPISIAAGITGTVIGKILEGTIWKRHNKEDEKEALRGNAVAVSRLINRKARGKLMTSGLAWIGSIATFVSSFVEEITSHIAGHAGLIEGVAGRLFGNGNVNDSIAHHLSFGLAPRQSLSTLVFAKLERALGVKLTPEQTGTQPADHGGKAPPADGHGKPGAVPPNPEKAPTGKPTLKGNILDRLVETPPKKLAGVSGTIAQELGAYKPGENLDSAKLYPGDRLVVTTDGTLQLVRGPHAPHPGQIDILERNTLKAPLSREISVVIDDKCKGIISMLQQLGVKLHHEPGITHDTFNGGVADAYDGKLVHTGPCGGDKCTHPAHPPKGAVPPPPPKHTVPIIPYSPEVCDTTHGMKGAFFTEPAFTHGMNRASGPEIPEGSLVIKFMGTEDEARAFIQSPQFQEWLRVLHIGKHESIYFEFEHNDTGVADCKVYEVKCIEASGKGGWHTAYADPDHKIEITAENADDAFNGRLDPSSTLSAGGLIPLNTDIESVVNGTENAFLARTAEQAHQAFFENIAGIAKIDYHSDAFQRFLHAPLPAAFIEGKTFEDQAQVLANTYGFSIEQARDLTNILNEFDFKHDTSLHFGDPLVRSGDLAFGNPDALKESFTDAAGHAKTGQQFLDEVFGKAVKTGQMGAIQGQEYFGTWTGVSEEYANGLTPEMQEKYPTLADPAERFSPMHYIANHAPTTGDATAQGRALFALHAGIDPKSPEFARVMSQPIPDKFWETDDVAEKVHILEKAFGISEKQATMLTNDLMAISLDDVDPSDLKASLSHPFLWTNLNPIMQALFEKYSLTNPANVVDGPNGLTLKDDVGDFWQWLSNNREDAIDMIQRVYEDLPADQKTYWGLWTGKHLSHFAAGKIADGLMEMHHGNDAPGYSWDDHRWLGGLRNLPDKIPHKPGDSIDAIINRYMTAHHGAGAPDASGEHATGTGTGKAPHGAGHTDTHDGDIRPKDGVPAKNASGDPSAPRIYGEMDPIYGQGEAIIPQGPGKTGLAFGPGVVKSVPIGPDSYLSADAGILGFANSSPTTFQAFASLAVTHYFDGNREMIQAGVGGAFSNGGQPYPYAFLAAMQHLGTLDSRNMWHLWLTESVGITPFGPYGGIGFMFDHANWWDEHHFFGLGVNAGPGVIYPSIMFGHTQAPGPDANDYNTPPWKK